MERTFDRLRRGPFDVLVIGGGVYGAWTACDAAQRGLSVALVEKADWASGTSSASSKLIHGGLRYLEHFRVGLVKRSLRERSRLIRLAPHRIRPWRFMVPLFRSNRVGPLRLGAGLRLYDLLSRKDAPGGQRLRLNKEEAAGSYPFLENEGLMGALTYGDCITDDGRFVLEIVQGAIAAGAEAINYAEATELLFEGSRVAGAVVRDRLEDRSLEVRASAVVDSSGPWAGRIDGCPPLSMGVRLTKGGHLVFPPLPAKEAFLFLTRGEKRVFFLIPWHGRTLVGTTDTDYDGDPDKVAISEEDIKYLFEQIGHYFRPGIWDAHSIKGMSAGLRALADVPGRDPSSLSREWVLDQPTRGLLVSIGGKFTTARVDAASIVDRVMESLGKSFRGRPPTENSPFPACPRDFPVWKEDVRHRGVKLGIDEETADACCLRYGTAVENVLDLVRENPHLAGRLKGALPFCRAEVVHGAGEMTIHLVDLLRRRLPLMIISRPDRSLLEEAAGLAAQVLGWDENRRLKEIESAFEVWQKPFSLLED